MDRIRINSSDIARAPDVQSAPPRLTPHSPSVGEVFGSVGNSQGATSSVGQGIWANPKLLFSLAGLTAAIVACLLTDGIGGMTRAEAKGDEEYFAIMALVLIGAFTAFLTAFISAADDFASGALGRGGIFAGIGFLLGTIGTLVGLFCIGIITILIDQILDKAGIKPPESVGGLVFFSMLHRTPIWLMLGVLCGIVICTLGRSWRRVLLGAIGGAVGGLLGGLLFDPIGYMLGDIQAGGSAWFSRLIGFSVMGITIGFAIAFAEQAAKQAWLSIERGRLIGKQFIIYRNPTRIGASYSNDVFLFKDQSVQPDHARITKRGGGYQIESLPGALIRVNGQPVASRAIKSGDTVQIGETVMRFQTRSN